MKLNKFLTVAVAAAVLPLSVAKADGPDKASEDAHSDAWEAAANAAANPTWNTPTAKEGKDGENKHADAAEAEYKKLTATTAKGEPLVQPEKPAYKPSNGTFKVDKGTEAPKADQTKKVLPKTSAVK